MTQINSSFTPDQTTRLTGITPAQLRHWTRTGFFVPSINLGSTNRPRYLYSFRDLASLRVLHALRNKARVSLAHLREVKTKLIHMGDDVWAKTTLYVLKRQVHMRNSDTGTMEALPTGQIALEIPLPAISGALEAEIRTVLARDPSDIGRIEKRREVLHNQSVIAGTRIPVRVLRAFADAGFSIAAIQAEYPTLTQDDIAAALAHSDAA